MPTGYTADVGDGKVTEFSDFAMQCARAFGALILMRDDPKDATIPEAFAPSSYYTESLAEARSQLATLQAMTIDQRQVAADKAHAEAIASWDDYEEKKRITRERYDAMLEKVAAWHPPTPDHVEMKKFMDQQLRESIRFDCGPAYSQRPQPKKRDEWFEEAVASAKASVDRYEIERQKEIDRAQSRTDWVAALRKSLQPVR